MTRIDPAAIVSMSANLGKNVTIGASAYIGPNVTIGDNCTIQPYALIDGHTTLGNNNTICSYAALGTPPQDLKHDGSRVELIIGNDNTIGSYTLLNAGTTGGGRVTRIGHHNILKDYTHIAHDVQLGNHCVMEKGTTFGGHVEVGNHAFLGEASLIHQFVRIGDYARIEKGGAVAKDIPPYCIAGGNRAVLQGLNTKALQAVFDDRLIEELNETYTILFGMKQPPKKQAEKILSASDTDEVRNLALFVQNSKRGIPFR